MNVTRDRVLRALSRFDAASVGELAECFGGESAHGGVRKQMQRLIASGQAERLGDSKRNAKYRITELGRAELQKVAA